MVGRCFKKKERCCSHQGVQSHVAFRKDHQTSGSASGLRHRLQYFTCSGNVVPPVSGKVLGGQNSDMQLRPGWK